MEALLTRSDRESSSLFQYDAIAASGIITIARTPLMIGRCLGGRANDRIAEQEMTTSGSALGCRLDRAGQVVVFAEVERRDADRLCRLRRGLRPERVEDAFVGEHVEIAQHRRQARGS